MTFNSIASFAGFFIVFALGLLILLRGNQSRVSIVYALFLFSIAVWALGIFGLITSVDGANAWIWMRVLNLGFIFIPVLFIHSTFLLLRLPGQWLLPVSYLLTFLFYLPLSLTPLFTRDIAKTTYYYVAVPGELFPAFLVFLVGLWLYGFYLLFRDYQVQKGSGRNRTLYVLLASIIVLAGGLAVLPALAGQSIYPIWNLTNIIYGGMIAYAILKYRLMDITLVIKKTTAYSLVASALTFFYVFVVLSLEYVSRAVFGYYSFWSAVFASLIIAVTFTPFRERLQGLVDRFFFRQTIEYQKIIREVTHLIASVINLNTLFRLIDRTVVRALCIRSVAIMLSEEDGRYFRVEKTNGHSHELLNHQLPASHPLIAFFSEKKDAVVLDEIKEALERDVPDAARGKLRAIADEFLVFAAEVAIPAFSRGRLVGILLLGEKLSGEPYSSEDLDLLLTMASEAGIAIENAKLYRDITETRDYLNSIVQGSEDAIFTLNLKGNVLSWNKGAENIFGYKYDEVFGRRPPFFSEKEALDWIGRVKAGEPIKAAEIIEKSKQGTGLDLLLTLSPVRDAADNMIAVSAIVKDISQLRRLDLAKQEFLYSVSNELRAPLTPIQVYLAQLQRGELGGLTDKQKEALAVITGQSNHLHNLIDSVIDISRIEAGRPLEIAQEPVFLDEVVREASDSNQPAYRAKGIRLETESPPARIALMADHIKLLRVMENLLGNAYKFTPSGGTVRIAVREENKQALVAVSDTGIGLAAEHREKIFEKFYQVNSEYTRATGGIGMGLTIAREIVEAHGGRIWAESAGLGRGLKLTFTLPIA
ncbi:MAG: PAS domain S-box protein [Candidatus Saganbacteria bacterium]|nr:PAS domain S-box protein [Candidatus Saganbacteria bacterium]